MKLKRIAITGPESTGKSQLAESLARHFNSAWVPEFARQYINELNRPYTYDDILIIARGQMEMESRLTDSISGFLFCDTELIVTKIWCVYKYGQCHPWILDRLDQQQYDLYLLCDIDLPWQPDPQREHPLHRSELFQLYIQELKQRKFPFHIVTGRGSQRLENALEILRKNV
ncbi:MAG: ATP-binding protein [Bacteroidales bacterium]|nr:ATP-binding protein [Bacteroidales bacterium]MCF8402759.1 ATP-binding protein [Bacteroidales bacterium]